jgi:ferredoxin
MKAAVDGERCEGYGTCAAIAPEVFILDEWGYAQVATDVSVPEDQEELVKRAALECPMTAITYED